MSCRPAYIDSLSATGPHLAALLGLIARIRQHVTGELPTRKDWIEDLDAFVESDRPSQRKFQTRDGEKILDKYFPVQVGKKKTQLKLGADAPQAANLIINFIEHWFEREPAVFKSKRAAAILDRLNLSPEGVMERLNEAQSKDLTAQQMIGRIVGGLAEQDASWSKGLLLFDWPAISTGFVAYEPIDHSDVRGLYLVVREARDWTTFDEEAPSKLVRDLLWVCAVPGQAVRHGKSEFEGVGRFFSTYNHIVYSLQRGVATGDWSRYPGASLRAAALDNLDFELACPTLDRVQGDAPYFAMMTAYTKKVQSPGAWKAIVWRVHGSEWGDVSTLEPELEMFRGSSGGLRETKVEHLLAHLRNRGVIGEFPAGAPGKKKEGASNKSPSRVFHEALIDYDHAPKTRTRLKAILREIAGSEADPSSAILAAWPRIAPNQIILPPIDNARVTHPDAIESLFGRNALGEDKIAEALSLEVSRSAATMVARRPS